MADPASAPRGKRDGRRPAADDGRPSRPHPGSDSASLLPMATVAPYGDPKATLPTGKNQILQIDLDRQMRLTP
jgi:hypothetical protein